MDDRQPERGGALTAAGLPALLEAIHDRLRRHRAEIDAINVFPVPDSDTGSNLVATIRCALDGLEDSRGGPRAAIRAAVGGALRGARGNSGLILSQLVLAVGDALVEGPIGPPRLAEVLARATELAYEGVADPVEGTMLTVLRAVADRAATTAGAEDLAAVTEQLVGAARDAVVRTPEQLEVLRSAGVVDAGGRGLEVVLAAVHEQVSGREVALEPVTPPQTGGGGPTASATGLEGPGGGPRFEVQYLLEAPGGPAGPSVAEDLRRRLSQLGDSVAVVTSPGLVSVHVHTDRVDAAIGAARPHGTPDEVRVVSFAGRSAGPGHAPALAAVAVVVGPGLAGLAARTGATVLEGSDGRLPDADALVRAVEAAEAGTVAVLPGHPDVVAAARRAAARTSGGGRTVVVVDSADSPTAVLAALAVLDPAAGAEGAAELEQAAAGVLAGEVVAVPAGLQAVLDGRPLAVAPDALAALGELLEAAGGDHEVITLVAGAAVEEEERGRAERLARQAVPGAEVVVLGGGQTHAPYLVGFE